MPEVEVAPVAEVPPTPVAEEVKPEVPVEPAAPAPPPDPPQGKIRRVIQPKDEKGNPIGSPHVYEGISEQEVMDKMADAIANGTLRIRQFALREKTIAGEALKVPEGAELEEEIPEPKPRELTADERFRIAEKIKNPDTVVEAYRELYEATTGRKPEDEARAKVQVERNASITRSHAEANAFAEAHPEFRICPENSTAMLAYMSARKMALTKKNFEIAFKELSADGLLLTKPEEAPPPAAVVPAPEPPAPAPVVAAPAAPEVAPRTEAPAARAKTAFPSAITRDQATGTGAPKPKKPSAEELAMMNADQYKAYLESQGLWGK